MKTKSDNLSSKLPHSDGMTVPEGFFDDFSARMSAKIAELPDPLSTQSATLPRSNWQRIRPYVYMAAMFAGVWCMLKMFAMLTSSSTVPFDSNPIVAEALNNDTFVNEYIISDINQWDLYDDMMDEGISPESFSFSESFNESDLSEDF